jgi:hypothetical protein
MASGGSDKKAEIREFYQGLDSYSWWSYMRGQRGAVSPLRTAPPDMELIGTMLKSATSKTAPVEELEQTAPTKTTVTDFKQALETQIASIVETGAPTDTFIKELRGLSHKLSDTATDLEYLSEYENFIIGGLDERRVVEALSCTWPELRRWREDGRFPKTEGTVRSFEWRSAGKYTVPVIVEGWKPETIAALKPQVEIWRAEHKAAKRKVASPSSERDTFETIFNSDKDKVA